MQNLSLASLLVQIVSIILLQVMYTDPDNLANFYFSFSLLVVLNYAIVAFFAKQFALETYENLKDELIVYL
jgi:hypothetical protein